MKNIQLSTIHQWQSVQTETISSVQNSVPNVLPNDYGMSEEKLKTKTVRQKLRMANSNADISQSHKILSEKGNDTGSQGVERCEAVTKTVLKIKPHGFLQSHMAESSDAQFDWDGILKELKQCHTYDEIVAVV